VDATTSRRFVIGQKRAAGNSGLQDHKFKGRREDLRLLTGRGRYTTDHEFNGQVVGHFLRADRAHARIARLDMEAARELPGVLDILTGADLVATGWKGTPSTSFFKGVGGSTLREKLRQLLGGSRKLSEIVLEALALGE